MGRSKKIVPKRGKATVSLAQFHRLSHDSVVKNNQQVPTSNKFDILVDDIEAPSVPVIPTKAQVIKKTTRVPPIVVTGTSVGDVHKKIVAAGVVQYSTNTTTKGIVVTVQSTEDFKVVVNTLKKSKTNFFTHQLPEERTTKVVLFGLPVIPVEEVKSALAECNIHPASVKNLLIRKKRYDDQAMYLLHFAKGSMTIGELKQVRVVNHHRVHFEYYAHKVGPIQCRNCQHFGHGEANCFRTPVCVKCADAHSSNTCPLSKSTTDPEGKITQSKLRCANCGDHHTANYRGCPARTSFAPPKRKLPPPPPQFQFTPDSFPALATASHPRNVVVNTNTTNYANQLRSHHREANDNAVDLNEIGQIVEDVFNHLSKCKSKKDLITVIVQITAKYCFKNALHG